MKSNERENEKAKSEAEKSEQELIREPNEGFAAKVKNEKQQGEYTVEDYHAIPDEYRMELIDGVLFEMDAPESIHQIIQLRLASELNSYIESKKGKCMAIAAPLDVQLDRDDKTMVQPDVVVICDREKITRKGIYGAPDLVMEILSKSTRKKDMYLKNEKYEQAGVREYWLLDPDWKTITVYDYQKDTAPAVYSFEDEVPVRIFNEDFIINFKEIYEYVHFLYE